MKMRLMIGVMGALAVMASTPPLYAQELDKVMAHALAKNPGYRAAQYSYNASRKNQYVSFGNMLPTISLYARQSETELERSNYNDATVAPIDIETDSESQGVTVDYTLFASGANVNTFRSARANARRDHYQFISLEQQTLLDVATVYLDVLRDRGLRDLNRKNVAVSEERLSATRDRFEVGTVTRTEVAQAEAALAQAQAGMIAAEAIFQGTLARYRAITGLSARGLKQVTKLPKLPARLSDALAIARRESPVLGFARENANSGRFQLYSAVGANLPRITIQGRYDVTDDPQSQIQLQRTGTRDTSTSVTTTLTVPIFRGGAGVAGIRGARDARSALMENVHATSRQVTSTVTIAWHGLQSARARQAAVESQIRASEIALDGVQQENQIGTRTLLEVLDAERALLNARTDLIGAERDRTVSHFALLSSLGRLTANALAIAPKEIAAKKDTKPPNKPAKLK